MTANEAPEKLYLISDEYGVTLSYDPSTKLQYGNRYDFVDKEVFPIEEGCEVEYIRKDASIKKACEGIEHLLSGYIIRNFNFGDSYEIDTLIEDLKNYMKGE